MPDEFVEELAGLRIPDPRGMVSACRTDARSIRRKGKAIDRILMAFEQELTARRDVLDISYRLIISGEDDRFAIGRKCYCIRLPA